MGMVLTEEQQMLRDSARGFVDGRVAVADLRKLRDARDETGYADDVWRQMVELGFAGVALPEEYGGSGFGWQGLGLIMEETGRNLTASPLFSTVCLGATALLTAGNEAQRADYLPKIAAGELTLALAVDEGPHHAPERTALAAEPKGHGVVLNGRKLFVLDGHRADKIVVAARTTGQPGDRHGLTLFLIDGEADGVVRTRTEMVDSRNAAIVDFANVKVPSDAVLGPVDGGYELLDRILDVGRIMLAAEMMGAAQAAFDKTLAYLKERTQFGQAIGQFQALQHRAAQMFSELEMSRSVVMEALTGLDENSNQIALLASLAKARAGDTFHLVAREAVQMHGGIGMTDEHEIGFYLKRCAAAEATFGASAYHRDRYAALEGF